jgi:hypothetical protein
VHEIDNDHADAIGPGALAVEVAVARVAGVVITASAGRADRGQPGRAAGSLAVRLRVPRRHSAPWVVLANSPRHQQLAGVEPCRREQPPPTEPAVRGAPP